MASSSATWSVPLSPSHVFKTNAVSQVSANGRGFIQGLVLWFALAIPSVYTNSMIKFLQSKLSISFRTRLTRYCHDLYLDKNNTFYKVVSLDSRIGPSGADQYLTTDVNRFCETLSALYSNVSKPTLDLLFFNYQLGRSIGGKGSLGLLASYVATALILRRITPAFGKLAAIEARLEGDFRQAHARIGINAEEIAFYGGGATEKGILDRAYLRLIKVRPLSSLRCLSFPAHTFSLQHVNSIYKIRIAFAMVSLPFFPPASS
jgi:ATP-binding cassette subfamily D (ALD) long-chain fatty acid import protein